MTGKPSLSQYVSVDTSPARLARIWGGVSERLERAPRRRRPWVYRAVAITALAAVAGAGTVVALQQGRPGAPWQRAALATAGDSLVVDLDDGSRLELAARSRVEMLETSETAVSVRLNHGRVECDLKPRAGRRFAVLAEGVEVRVTGTRFSVELGPEKKHVVVAVSRGSVEVDWPHGGEPIRRLTAGESLTIDLSSRRDGNRVQPLPSAAVSAGPELPEAPEASVRAPLEPPAARDRPPVTLDSASARELLDMANASRRDGDVVAAARAYDLLLSKYGSDPRAGLAAFELGRLRMNSLGDLAGAVQAFRRAIALAPGSGFREDAMARLVDAYAGLGRTAECRAARDAYLKSYPRGVHAGSVAEKCGAR